MNEQNYTDAANAEMLAYCRADLELTNSLIKEINRPRRLATVRRISDLLPIAGADRIEVAVVDGWKVVVKKGEFEVGDLAVYFEIDSFVPTEIAPFLTSAGKEPREYNGVKGERLRTVKMKGQISQGLLLPIKVTCGNDYLGFTVNGFFVTGNYFEGDDLTQQLNVQKYDPPISGQSGMFNSRPRGNWPSGFPKTDQERVQNLRRQDWEDNVFGKHFEISEKLDGSSCTFYMDKDGVFHVMSRNVDITRDETNPFWMMAIKYDVEAKIRNLPNFESLLEDSGGIALRGELVGPGICGNKLKLQEYDFYVYDLYSVKLGYAPAPYRDMIVAVFEMKHVPVHTEFVKANDTLTADILLEMAKGKSAINPEVTREGLVFKCIEDPNFSFKVINNDWLLEFKE